MKLFRFAAIMMLLMFFVRAGQADDSLLCLKEAVRLEKRERIKTNLLSAISLVESGRYSKQYPTGVSWPWTVTAEGKGQFFSSKDEALNAVLDLQSKGVENIDVGCMQINLKYHPDAFKSINDALDPVQNVAYAAEFLKRNYRETKSWGEAATRYHSRNVNKAFKYEDKLLDAWNRLTKYGNPADPEQIARLRNSSKETVDKINKKVRQIKQKHQQKEAETIKSGSEQAREMAAQWRKEKLEEYMAKKKAKPTEEPIFEDAPAMSDKKSRN
ncbi:MAG: transglycosylase SLT domain-containing protein [Alphaproteobacteria bacterium]|nr:transglycosylase SLT domain-containing protein [Alphaproteobacteria bacterium]